MRQIMKALIFSKHNWIVTLREQRWCQAHLKKKRQQQRNLSCTFTLWTQCIVENIVCDPTYIYNSFWLSRLVSVFSFYTQTNNRNLLTKLHSNGIVTILMSNGPILHTRTQPTCTNTDDQILSSEHWKQPNYMYMYIKLLSFPILFC